MTATGNVRPVLPAAGTGRRPWWANKVFLVPAALIVVVAATLVTDLPTSTTRASQVSDAVSVLRQVNSDVAPCRFAVGEALALYADVSAGRLGKAQASQVPGLLSDDQSACSFTDDSIYQLSTLQVPGARSGRALGQVVSTVTLWATSDALSAIEAVQAYVADRSDRAALSRLARAEALMGKDQARADAEVAFDDRLLGTRLPALELASGRAGGRPG